MKRSIILFLILTALGAAAQPIEKFGYNLKYGFIKGGEAVLSVKDTTYEGNPALHYYLQGNTVGLADALYSVNDVYESYVDPVTILPYMTIRNVKERKYRFYNETYFYNEQDSIYSQKSGGHKVPDNLLDILSIFFYLRQNDLLESMTKGDEVSVPVYHNDEYFNLILLFRGTGKIKSKFGEKECYIVSPIIDKGDLLKRNDGLKFYITKDKDKIPLVLELDLNVGALRAELDKYEKNGIKFLK